MSEVYESIKNTLEIESKAILDALSVIDPQAVEQAVDVIASCKGKVATSGCGTSGAAGKKIAHTLNCVNRPALFLTPSDAVHGGMGCLLYTSTFIPVEDKVIDKTNVDEYYEYGF